MMSCVISYVITCNQVPFFPFCEGENDAWYIYFMRHLSVVQNLDFCLIGRKKKILCSPALIGQAKYLASSASHSRLPIPDRNQKMIEEFFYLQA